MNLRYTLFRFSGRWRQIDIFRGFIFGNLSKKVLCLSARPQFCKLFLLNISTEWFQFQVIEAAINSVTQVFIYPLINRVCMSFQV